ncbi:MAG: 50S ribosomal protein L18 [Patescibacteria group bacterium]|nr:50S ribosomal protein L18 [Patescibacteria group bacterium]
MDKNKKKLNSRIRRHNRVRAKISGTGVRPRLSVFKSNSSIYLQLIDDRNGKTLVSANVKEVRKKDLNKTEQAAELGKLIAEKAKKEKIDVVVFDKGPYKYHGRVKAVADAARESGLKF